MFSFSLPEFLPLRQGRDKMPSGAGEMRCPLLGVASERYLSSNPLSPGLSLVHFPCHCFFITDKNDGPWAPLALP